LSSRGDAQVERVLGRADKGAAKGVSMARKETWGLLVLLLAAPALWAQTADELLAKYVQARGGADKIKAVRSVRMTGSMTTGDLSIPVTLVLKRPNMVRMDFDVQGTKNVRAFDGQAGWTMMPVMGNPAPAPITGPELHELEDQADIDGPLVDAKAKGNTVELVGKENVDGTDAYKLKLTHKNGDVSTIYLDAKTYLEVREDSQHTVQGTQRDFETKIADYRDVNGLKFPFALTSGIKDTGQVQKLAIDKVELDVPVDADSFKMPAPLPAEKPAGGS
jgi:outer membrane lipoprotein-sorting protein